MNSRSCSLCSWTLGALLAGCGGGGGGNSAPVASFTLTVSSGDAPLRVDVDASASTDADGAIVSYDWAFGDGGTATGITAVHVYQNASNWPLELTLTDDQGARATRRVYVNVTPAPVSYVGLYASSLIGTQDVLFVIDRQGSVLSGTLSDGAGRTGLLAGTIAPSGQVAFQVTWTTPGCAGGLDVQGQLTSDGITFTFGGSDCMGTHAGGQGEVLSEGGEVLAFGEPHPGALTAEGDSLFWSSASAAPLKRLDLASGTIDGLAPSIGTLRGLTHDGTDLLWTEAITSGIGACGSATESLGLRRSTDGVHFETLDVAQNCSPEVTSDIVVAGADVFWAQRSSTSPDAYTIRRTPLDASPPESFVVTEWRIGALAADAQYLYWCEEGIGPLDPSRVRRMPLAGGTIEELLATTTMVPAALALSADLVLAAERNYAGTNGDLVSIPKAGGAQTVLATFGSTPRRVICDGTTVGWSTDTQVGRLELPGGAAVPLAQTLAPALDLVFDGNQLAWIENPGGCCSGNLRAVPLAGGSVLELAAPASPQRLSRAPDGTLKWTESSPYPSADSALRFRSPAGSVGTLLESFGPSAALAVDASDVYCAQGWWIKRVPRAGGTPERFAQAGFTIGALALDADFVYWEQTDGSIARKPKAGGIVEGISSGNGIEPALVVAQGKVLWVDSPDRIRVAPLGGGPASDFASGLAYPTALVTDGEFAYFNAQDAGLLMRKPIGGGELEIVTSFGGGSLTTLAVDATHLYAIDQIEVERTLKGGGGEQTIARVWNDVFERGSVASAGGYVYWSETLLGTVLRRYVGP